MVVLSICRVVRVYPRVGGETAWMPDGTTIVDGLSPRGRGNLPKGWTFGVRDGSIPAWAGKPYSFDDSMTSHGVYPRVGGETFSEMPAWRPA